MANAPETEVRGFDDKPRKNFKLPKWGIVTLCIFALILAIALIIPSFLDQAKYKDLVISKVEEATGYKVSWAGDIGISLLPLPHVTVNEAIVSNGAQKILTIKKADVSVELMPLLQKKIQISNVELDQPDVSLIVDAAGRQTWMTDKLQQQKDTAETPENEATPKQKADQQVTLDKLKITNGHIVYKDMSKGAVQEVSNLNTDLRIKSLKGPFDIKANLNYNGNDIALKGNTGEMIDGKATPVDFDIELPKLNVTGNYKGEINTSGELAVKGDLKLAAKDVEKTISALSKSDTKLPKGLNGALNLTTAVLYDGDTAALNNLVLALGDLSYKGGLKVSGLKTSASPLLNIDLVSTAKDVKSSEPLVKILSDLSVKGAGTFINNVATIDQGTVQFEGQTINLAGTYTVPAKTGARPVLNATIKADKIDIDDITQQLNPTTESAAQKAANAKSQASSKSGAIKGMTLPFDGTVRGAIGSLNFGGQNYSNVNFDLTNGGNRLNITNLSLNTVADTSVAAKGVVADTSKLSGLDINASVKTGNVEGLAKAYNVPLKLEQKLGAASVDGNVKGSLDNLSFNGTADAMKFAVTAAGSVQSAMSSPKIDNLNLRVRHPSLQEAVRNFNPGFVAPGSFNGGVDLATSLAMNGKSYKLSGIKGSIGGTTIAGDIAADAGGAKPVINGNLSFGSMVFDSPAPAAGTTSASSKPSSAPASSSETRWSREAIDTSWMNKFNADLSIKAASITQGLWKLTNANLAFKLNDGSLTIGNLDANALGGRIAINGNMKGGTPKEPISMNWTAKANALDARQLISALQNKQSDTLSGTIDNFDVSINTSGLSPAALVYALGGKGSVNGKNIVVKGIDAAKLADAARGSYKPLERAGTLFSSFSDGQTQFTTFDSAFTIASGIVNFSQIKFDGPTATLSSTGNVNLPRWTVDLKNNMTVKNSELPPFDFSISGPIDQPLQTGGSVIEGFLRDKAKAKVEKLITDKLGDKLGFPLGGSATQQTAPATVTPAATDDATGTAAPVEKTKEQKKAEQIEQGVKALQGLFGQ